MIIRKQFLLMKLNGLIAILFVSPFFLHSQTYESEKAFRNQQDSVFQILFTDSSAAKEKITDLISKEDQMSDSTKGLNYNLKGIYFNIIGDDDKSIKNFNKAAILLQNHPYRLNKVRMNIGTSLRNNGHYEASIKEFEKLLDYFSRENDSLGYAKILG